jgi:hypothetical protein
MRLGCDWGLVQPSDTGMKRILELFVAIVVGSFVLHCAPSGKHGNGGGGGGGGDSGVGDAAADGSGCCTVTSPTFTKIAEGDLAMSGLSPVISVGAYRQVMLYMSGVASGCGDYYYPLFRPDANTVFGSTGQQTALNTGMLIRVDGTDMEILGGCAGHYVVAGIGLN